MKQNTYYFSHDYNAHNDFKILFLRQQLGMEGYGIYWFLIESLADAGGYLPLKIIPVLAMQMQTTEIKVQAVIESFDLFEINDEQFFSNRLIMQLEKIKELKISKSIAGKISAERKKKQIESTPDEQMFNTCSTKERKEKEIKGNEIKVNKLDKNDLINLPEQYLTSAIEQVYFIKKIRLETDVVKSLYSSFLATNLDDNKFYHSNHDFFKHFLNWLKNQKFETNGKKSNSADKIDQYRQFANRFNSDNKQ